MVGGRRLGLSNSMRKGLLILVVVCLCGLSALSGFYFGGLAQISNPTFAGAPKPDPYTFQAALTGLERYRSNRPYKDEWGITSHPDTGVIETNWFPEHKGEVKLKVQIAVRDRLYRVDVWQQHLITNRVIKTDGSRRTELKIQSEIEKVLKEPAK
jgi:hypothetical protein